MMAFMHKTYMSQELITEAVELATAARKDGILALEGRDIGHPFLKQGIDLCIDGHPPEVVTSMLEREIDLNLERQDMGIKMFVAIGDAAPAMGMIGTLIGLVQMLANMDDPKTIGPAMAVALLTTLYGAVIANCVAIPIAEKLKNIMNDDRLNKMLDGEMSRCTRVPCACSSAYAKSNPINATVFAESLSAGDDLRKDRRSTPSTSSSVM